MGHEYYHAGFYGMGLNNPTSHHAYIREWEYQHALKWNYKVGYYRNLNNMTSTIPTRYLKAAKILGY